MNQDELFGDFQAIQRRLENMQQRLQGIRGAPRPAFVVDILDIRDTFYNSMVMVALKVADLKQKDTPVLLSALTLLEAMDQ